MNKLVPSRHILYSIFFLLGMVSSCGPKKEASSGGGKKRSGVESAFNLAASEQRLPVRMMMAIAYLESGISPLVQSTAYYDSQNPRQQIEIGTTLTETAFGITRKELGLSNNENGDDLKVQIAAYGKWVREKLKDNPFELKSNPSDGDEKYWWIWKLSQLHRNGNELTHNIRVVWAINLINILNSGFVWQDPASGAVMELAKESPAIEISKLTADAKNWLDIEYDASDISNARMFELTSEDNTTLENIPNHIEVIHCPLTLSGCLELQDTTVQNDLALGAHYVIPQDDSVVKHVLQIVQHQSPVILTDKNGHKKPVTDAIVIMLVGNSGQYVDGDRVNADPTWFTSWQLKKMGAVIGGVCKAIARDNPNVDLRICQTPEEAKGVHIQNQGLRSSYRWGDVPDFDKSIFYAYLKTSDHNLNAEAHMEFKSPKRTFRAGTEIKLLNSFHPGVRYLRLERAVRCRDKQLVWEVIQGKQLKPNETNYQASISVLDAGPNLNGRQFLRMLVHDNENNLTGWAISDFYVTGYEPELYPPGRACAERESSNNREEDSQLL